MSNALPAKPAEGALHAGWLTDFSARAPSLDARMAAGKALRAKVPHAAHAQYRPAAARADPVAVLEAQAKTRLPTLVPIRHARMLASPFAFLRGSAAVMAADLAGTPVTGLSVQACGDAHLANFGVFASAERNLVFGDQRLRRDAARSLGVGLEAARRQHRRGGTVPRGRPGCCEDAARAAVRSYRKRMRDVRADVRPGRLVFAHRRAVHPRRDLAAAAREDAQRIDGQGAAARPPAGAGEDGRTGRRAAAHRRAASRSIVRETHTATGHPIGEAVDHALHLYVDSLPEDRKSLFSRYRVVDVARKVVGVGSVGTRCWVILLEGNGDDDPLFLQYKEAQASVLAPYAQAPLGLRGPARRGGAAADPGRAGHLPRLGHRIDGTHFYIRQLRDMKGGAEFEPGATSREDPPRLLQALRLGPGTGPRQVRRRRRYRRLPRQERRHGRGGRPLRRRLCRPDRARLRGARRGGQGEADSGREAS